MNDLLKQFITEECTPHVCRLLDDAIGDPAGPRHQFNFNRFDVTIEHDANLVLLQDVLDATAAGVERVPLAEFAVALGGLRRVRRGGLP